MKIHVMTAVGPNQYRVIVHVPTPAGNNSAGFAYSACAVASGMNVTELGDGGVSPGLGQTTTTERNAIIAGTVLEGSLLFTDDPADSNAQRSAKLDQQAAQLGAGIVEDFQRRFKWFGATRP